MITLPALLAVSALAASNPGHNECCFVIGAHVVVALGKDDEKRLGGGFDLGWQSQVYAQKSKRIDGVFAVWAEEQIAPNYGPVAHIWWVRNAWNASLGLRLGLEWPLRIGLIGGWLPGPAVSVELAPALSTGGWVGLDGQFAIDAPWLQGRIGTAITRNGWQARRVTVGPFAILGQPHNWPGVPNWWREPEPGDPIPADSPEIR